MACQHYTPGHSVHHIQAMSKYHRPGEIKKVSVLGHEGNWLTFEMDGALYRVWNHDPERIREFHDAAIALQNLPHRTLESALYYTSVRVMSVRSEGRIHNLYPRWDGADDSGCSES